MHGQGIPVTVASTTYMGMNALHAAGGFGKLPAYQYLVEEVGMEIDKPDTAQGNSFIHAFPVLNYIGLSYDLITMNFNLVVCGS